MCQCITLLWQCKWSINLVHLKTNEKQNFPLRCSATFNKSIYKLISMNAYECGVVGGIRRKNVRSRRVLRPSVGFRRSLSIVGFLSKIFICSFLCETCRFNIFLILRGFLTDGHLRTSICLFCLPRSICIRTVIGFLYALKTHSFVTPICVIVPHATVKYVNCGTVVC